MCKLSTAHKSEPQDDFNPIAKSKLAETVLVLDPIFDDRDSWEAVFWHFVCEHLAACLWDVVALHQYYRHDFNGTSSLFFDKDKNKQNYQNSIGIIRSLKQQALFPKFCNSNSNSSSSSSGNNLQDECLDATTHHRRYTSRYDKSAIFNEYANILYGDDPPNTTHDKQLYEMMERVNLLHLLLPFLSNINQSPRGFQASKNEPQKLCDWSKVIIPKLASLDEWNENMIYEQLSKNNVTFISIGHRHSLLKYHRCVLYISGDGNWELLFDKNIFINTFQNNFIFLKRYFIQSLLTTFCFSKKDTKLSQFL
ncbi:ABC transporter, transmembrane region:ABC transporter [Reticulomyxa filosa]|uniref:ABC transporter, transmembrane region:ABC transporter n=1 Tax=Reticulomyxa filosa TaxID=46433 RepID=X6MCX7_RETFI|nr:ABC transporter, transmembrane region:ABC transporter [Reticulomyxa filosa]|eukprot:ETO11516.1 ABC transporter, transmembrane region:ABC transporter [Reticulomyxa filosa]